MTTKMPPAVLHRQRARARVRVSRCVALTTAMLAMSPASPALGAGDGPQNIPNAAIADQAERRPNGTFGNECLVFVADMIRAAGGPGFTFGFKTGTYQAQWAARATPVGSLAEVQRGDIVQWGGGAGGTLDPHTAIITAGGPDPQVIDSNYAGRHIVSRGSLASRSPAGARYRVWRLGKLSVGEGAFVNATDTGRIYRIAGGAPLYVDAWAPFGGGQPSTPRSQTEIDAMPRVPADGTFLHGQDTGHVYRVAGGAPLYVNSWAAYGGPQPTVGISQWSIDNGALGHLNLTPADGTLLHGQETGQVYRVAGGAPLYITAWGPIGGPQPTTGIPQWTIDNNALGRMRPRPDSGTWLEAGDTGRVYRVAGGAPLHITSWQPFGGAQPTTRVTQATIDSGALGRLRTYPADGTLLHALETGSIYKVVGGAALPIAHWDHIGGPQQYVDVNQATIDGHHGHLRAVPADGTLVRTMPSGRVWRISQGKREELPSATAGAEQVSDVSVGSVPVAESVEGGLPDRSPRGKSEPRPDDGRRKGASDDLRVSSGAVRLPARVRANRTVALTAKGLRRGARLSIRWSRRGIQPVVRTTIVRGGRITLQAPRRRGTYLVRIHRGGTLIERRSIKVG